MQMQDIEAARALSLKISTRTTIRSPQPPPMRRYNPQDWAPLRAFALPQSVNKQTERVDGLEQMRTDAREEY
jgi:hypothetical protein